MKQKKNRNAICAYCRIQPDRHSLAIALKFQNFDQRFQLRTAMQLSTNLCLINIQAFSACKLNNKAADAWEQCDNRIVRLEEKNTHTTYCTSATSDIVAPGENLCNTRGFAVFKSRSLPLSQYRHCSALTVHKYHSAQPDFRQRAMVFLATEFEKKKLTSSELEDK